MSADGLAVAALGHTVWLRPDGWWCRGRKRAGCGRRVIQCGLVAGRGVDDGVVRMMGLSRKEARAEGAWELQIRRRRRRR